MNRNDRPVPTEIEITPEMIQAGVASLHDWIGYQYQGDARPAVAAIFTAMLGLVPRSPDVRPYPSDPGFRDTAR